MKFKTILPLVSIALTGFMIACNQPSSFNVDLNTVKTSSVIAGPTNQLAIPNVFTSQVTAVGTLKTAEQNDDDADRQLFTSAQGVSALQPWKAAGARAKLNGEAMSQAYSLVFTDLLGVTFAYVSQISRDVKDGNPEQIALSGQPNADVSSDRNEWRTVTIVNGANTRRATMLATFSGAPILYGIYGPEAKANGVSMNNIKRLVMPSLMEYWAELRDGSYYDLLERKVIPADTVNAVRKSYKDTVKRLKKVQKELKQRNKKDWEEISQKNEVNVSACPDGSDTAECVAPATGQVAAKSLTNTCAWFVCWVSSGSMPASKNVPSESSYILQGADDYIGSYPQNRIFDNNQLLFFYNNAYHFSGCSPTAAANLFWWWEKKANLSGQSLVTGAVEYYSGDQSLRRIQELLRGGMGTFDGSAVTYTNGSPLLINGKQVFSGSSLGWTFAPAMRNYINARKVYAPAIGSLKVADNWGFGWAFGEAVRNHLVAAWQNGTEIPVMVSIYGQNKAHTAVASSFNDYGAFVTMVAWVNSPYNNGGAYSDFNVKDAGASFGSQYIYK
jgi:hypothetical protein